MAQMPGGMPGNGMGPGNIGHVYGKLMDTDSKPVNGASVMLMRKKMDSATKKIKEVLVKAMITKANGDFSFDELPVMGGFQLKISSSGFKATEQAVSFMPKMEPGAARPAAGAMPSFDKDLGKAQCVSCFYYCGYFNWSVQWHEHYGHYRFAAKGYRRFTGLYNHYTGAGSHAG